MNKFLKGLYEVMTGKPHYSEVLSTYRAGEEYSDITFEQLDSIPYNKILDVYPNVTKSVKGIRIDTKSKSLCFRMEIKKGAELLCHKHSDCSEVVLLLSGKMVNLTNGKIVKKYRVMEIPEGELHCLKALEDTVAYIEFTQITK